MGGYLFGEEGILYMEVVCIECWELSVRFYSLAVPSGCGSDLR